MKAGRRGSRRIVEALFLTACLVPGVRAEPATTTDAFDGRWWVALTCDDTRDAQGRFVKGYQFEFWSTIDHGRFEGRQGERGQPSSLTYVGTVASSGAIEITAEGNSGKPEYTIGSVPTGSAYRYTMTGTLGPTSGVVERRELRPCRATLAKKGPI